MTDIISTNSTAFMRLSVLESKLASLLAGIKYFRNQISASMSKCLSRLT